MILRIAIPIPMYQIFEYLPPPGLQLIKPGVRVKVPFGHRTMIGILISQVEESEIASEKLKPTYEILDESPVLDQHQLKLGHWAAEYYFYPLGETLHQMLPGLLRKGGSTSIMSNTQTWQLTEVGRCTDKSTLKRSERQQNAWSILKAHPNGLHQRTLIGLGIDTKALSALKKKGLAQNIVQEVPNNIDNMMSLEKNSQLIIEPELTLNAEQSKVFNAISMTNHFKTHVIYGITGSGKTEVYLQLIAKYLMQGKQALVLVPEISLTPQTIKRFESRFNCPIFNLNSRVAQKTKAINWLNTREVSPCILIGTRSSVWAPLTKLGIIIIDEEHDISFKQQEGFLYSARDLAIFRAKMLDIPIVLGSATPSIETWENLRKSRYRLHQLTHRAGGSNKPSIHLEDLRKEKCKFGLSESLVKRISNQLNKGEQVLLFLNRRGYAPTLYCNDCGWIAHCERCDAKLTFHKKSKHLKCHYCDYQTGIPLSCIKCNSLDISTQGQGTEKLEGHLESLFPEIPVIRIDRDTTKSKSAIDDYVALIMKGKPCILIGTQMVAKGHHFPNVTLVAIVNIDIGLFSSDFRSSERTCQLLTQVSGRAGRSTKQGQVWIQTRHPNHPLLRLWMTNDYPAVADFLLEERELAQLPPCSFMILIRAESVKKSLCDEFLRTVSQKLFALKQASDLTLLGPATAPMERKANRFRMQLLLQSANRAQLHQVLNTALDEINTIPAAKSVRWSIDVDPQNLI